MTRSTLRGQSRLDDPTIVVITDGTPEAEASVMRERLQAADDAANFWAREWERVCATKGY